MQNHSNGETRTIGTICKELDALALTYLDKLEEYTQTWQITTSQLQQGFLNLAHAKYTMGSGKISQCSYDERMKAQARVTVDKDNNNRIVPLDPSSTVDDTTNTTSDTTTTTTNNNTTTTTTTTTTSSNLIKKKSSLRQRRRKSNQHITEWVQDENFNDTADKNEYEMNEKRPGKRKSNSNNNNDNTIIKTTGRRDPLHWFGILVSPSLRVSQDHFKTATLQIIEQANSIRELTVLEEKFKKLEKEKEQLMEKQNGSLLIIKADEDGGDD